MRKALGFAAVVLLGLALGSPVTAVSASKSTPPPVTLSGKVSNEGSTTAKNNAVSLEASDEYYFDPTFVKAKPGTTLKVTVKNSGKLQHTFTVPGQTIDVTLAAHTTKTVKVKVPASGALLFYCKLHGPNGSQGDFGMQGAIYTQANQPISNAAAATPTLKSADSKFGKLLVTDDGMTLYERDTDTPTQVSCTGACATIWPPAIVTDTPVAGIGIDPSKVGTIAGPNGNQLTYASHPLYRFSRDAAVGDTNGEGTAGVWWVLGTDGLKITAPK
jgi:predicted lipoprotein with Yx(FWY)xxD motif